MSEKPEGTALGENEQEQQKTKRMKRKRKKIFCVTTTIAATLSREQLLKSTLIETLVFLLFLITVIIYCTGLRSPSMFYLSRALKSQFIQPEFTVDERSVTFDDLRSAADFWNYLNLVFIKHLFWDFYYDSDEMKIKPVDEKNMILFENKVLGVPRIRQVKVVNQSCTVHGYFRRVMSSCFAEYTEENEDTESFGLKNGTAWTHTQDTGSIPYWGFLGTYEGGGFYTDLTSERNSTAQILDELNQNLWITRSTRAVFIDFSVYNANINLFAICKLVFEFPASGGLYTTSRFLIAPILRIGDTWDWVFMTCQYLKYFFAIVFLCTEIREMIFFRFAYFKKFWTYIDLSIIVLCITLLIYAFQLGQIVLPHRMDDIVPDDVRRIMENPNTYGNLESICAQHLKMRELASIVLFLNCIKLFKYLNFNRTMGQLNTTLEKCALDILGFSVMFFIAFVAFSELGYLIFGSQVSDFSTFGTAMFTLLRTILGDFDYSDLQRTNRILAPIYFVSYIFLVFFVLLNMFLAIITDTYSDVKTEIALTQREMQMTDYLKLEFNKLLRKFGCKQVSMKLEKKKEFNITISKIRDALRKCGFTDIEAEMFFARYDIDPMANINEEDIDKFVEDYGKAENKQKTLKDTYVKMSDFMMQEAKLEEIEETIATLAGRVTQLLQTLDQVKGRKQ